MIIIDRYRRTVMRLKSHVYLTLSMIFVVASIPLTLNVAEVPDTTAMTSGIINSLRWGFPLFYLWKFGTDLFTLGAISQGVSLTLHSWGLSQGKSLLVSWKLPLIASAIGSAYILTRLSNHVLYNKKNKLLFVFLISPATLLVSAAYGEVEILALLTLLLAIMLFIEDKWILGAIVTAAGVGIEYWPIVALIAPIILSVGSRKVRVKKSITMLFAFSVTLVTVFAQDVYTVTNLSQIKKTVTPVTTYHGTIGPSYPLSIWYFGNRAFAYKNWIYLFVIMSLVAIIIGSISAYRCHDKTSSYRVLLGTTGGILILSVLLDPRSLAQFSLILIAGGLLIFMALDLDPIIVSLLGLGSLTFITYAPLRSSWSGVNLFGALQSWSPGSSLFLTGFFTSVTITVALSILFVCTLSLLNIRDYRLGRLPSLALCGAQLLGFFVVPLASSQLPLWSNTMQSADSQLVGYTTMSAFQRPAVSYGKEGVVQAVFPRELWNIQQRTHVHPVAVAGLSVQDGITPYLVLRKVSRRTHFSSSEGKFCELTFHKVGSMIHFGGVSTAWLWLWLKTDSVSNLIALNVGIRSVSSFARQPTVRNQQWETVPFLLSTARFKSGTLFVVNLPCTLVGQVGSRMSVIPARGVGSVVLNGIVTSIHYTIDSSGNGYGVFGRRIGIVDSVSTSVKPNGLLGLWTLGFLWPITSKWRPPVWLPVGSTLVWFLGLLAFIYLMRRWWRDRSGSSRG